MGSWRRYAEFFTDLMEEHRITQAREEAHRVTEPPNPIPGDHPVEAARVSPEAPPGACSAPVPAKLGDPDEKPEG